MQAQLLGAIAELWKAAVNFVICVRLSVWNNSAPTRRIFMKFDIWMFFEIYLENSSFIKIGQEFGYFAWRLTYIFDHMSPFSS